MQPRLEKLYQDALVWDAHAGVFPSPEVDLNLLREWPDSGVDYLSINVGFDVMDWQDTLAIWPPTVNGCWRMPIVSCWSAKPRI